ncbi:hypothetical protein SAY86_020892 [Trapa natans]|uniref:Uncharacterized protein n=1 Tax=Trapa natans TaxID=22666 RepID=A0AAN7RF98_TRANT|nr:hypothetical protein SAY86_020892 [Trapa natans]
MVRHNIGNSFHLGLGDLDVEPLLSGSDGPKAGKSDLVTVCSPHHDGPKAGKSDLVTVYSPHHTRAGSEASPLKAIAELNCALWFSRAGLTKM